MLLGVVLCGATIALRLGVTGSQAAVSPTMHAVVHEDNTIMLTFDDGTQVGSQARTPPVIPPGTYTIRVVDDTDEHNFHLSGPGVDQSTSVGGMSSPTWTVTFQSGADYRFQCDTHFDFMYGMFSTSGSAGSTGSTGSAGSTGGSSTSGGSASSSGSTGSGTSALRGTLTGTVSASGKLTFAIAGKPVKRLSAGRYRITVVDKAATRSFVVREDGHTAITVSSVPFVGTRSLTLKLAAGHWSFYTTAGAKSTGAFVVVA
jgi:hypothetical protein